MTKPILIRGATVVDAQGERSGDVLVREGRIAAVGDSAGPGAGVGAEVVDATGKFLTPGLIDCHVHLVADAGPDFGAIARKGEAEVGALAFANALRALQAGVTTMRDLGGFRFAEIAARNLLRRGLLPAPRVLVSGQALTITGGHGHFISREAQGTEELVVAAREQFRAGADWIKIIATGGVLTHGVDPQASQYSVEEIRAVVQEARRAGRKVTAHAHGEGGIAAAVEGGVASIEHGTYLTEALAAKMAERGVFLVATAAAPRGIVDAGTARGVPQDHVQKAEATLRHHRDAVQRAVSKGVPLAMGTDAGTPFNDHGDNARELELLVSYGLKNEQALAAGTANAARLLGLDREVGRVQTGLAADLLLLDRNPLDDIAAYRTSLQRVMAAGRWAR